MRKQEVLRRAGASMGLLAAGMMISSCGVLFKGAAHEAENPGARDAVSEAATQAKRAFHVGEEAASQHPGSYGHGVEVLRPAVQTTAYQVFTNNPKVGVGTYKLVATHEADELDEDTLSSVECIVDAIRQTPDGYTEIMKGDSIYQKGPNDTWAYRVISSNLKDYVTQGELDPCSVVLSTLPGADN